MDYLETRALLDFIAALPECVGEEEAERTMEEILCEDDES